MNLGHITIIELDDSDDSVKFQPSDQSLSSSAPASRDYLQSIGQKYIGFDQRRGMLPKISKLEYSFCLTQHIPKTSFL